ncbi:proline-rich protein 2-like [Anoplophora glabripennis]|uniref:proline-rich protein 2-like n=1 Tax=Anoplophora glabripennis TaxID=217634 RepID=UPI0008741202|nr:proline-rich protein 2-like [Anoplophora glabripennis]
MDVEALVGDLNNITTEVVPANAELSRLTVYLEGQRCTALIDSGAALNIVRAYLVQPTATQGDYVTQVQLACAPPGNPVHDDVSSDEEDEMPPPEAAEAEDQGLVDLHPGRPIEPAVPQVGAQDQDGPHIDRPTESRLPYTEAQDQDGLHPGRLIKPTSHPGRQPTDHGRVQRLDDDRPPCPLIAYPEATPGPSHARPHAETKPPSQPPPAVGGPTKRPAQHFPGHLDIRSKRRPVRMVAISPPPTKRTQQPRPHERPGTSANPQQSQPAASRTTGAASVGQPPPPSAKDTLTYINLFFK